MENNISRVRGVHTPWCAWGHHITTANLWVVHSPHVSIKHSRVVASGAGEANATPRAHARLGCHGVVGGVPLGMHGGGWLIKGKRREGGARGRLGILRVHILLPAALDALVAVLKSRGKVFPDLAVGLGEFAEVLDARKLLPECNQGLLVVFILMTLERDIS